MKLKMYSIFDKKSLIYHPPQFCHNTGHALRHFQTQLKQQQQSIMAEYPEDFDIYEVGIYDDQTGLISAGKEAQHICNLAELKDINAPDKV